jgi:hypothetical protein
MEPVRVLYRHRVQLVLQPHVIEGLVGVDQGAAGGVGRVAEDLAQELRWVVQIVGGMGLEGRSLGIQRQMEAITFSWHGRPRKLSQPSSRPAKKEKKPRTA